MTFVFCLQKLGSLNCLTQITFEDTESAENVPAVENINEHAAQSATNLVKIKKWAGNRSIQTKRNEPQILLLESLFTFDLFFRAESVCMKS